MAKSAPVTQVLTEGRGNLIVPTIDLDHDPRPAQFIEFFHAIWSRNSDLTRFPDDNGARYDETVPIKQLVVPSNGEKPVVVLDYSLQPRNGRYGSPTERMRVLVPPEQVGPFRIHTDIEHQPRAMGTAGNRSHFTLHTENPETSYAILGDPDEIYTYSETAMAEWARLGTVIKNVVELVS